MNHAKKNTKKGFDKLKYCIHENKQHILKVTKWMNFTKQGNIHNPMFPF